jgi:hypothetical protein
VALPSNFTKWSDLTPAYRNRLKRNGVTAKSREAAARRGTYDVNRARGHVSTKPVGAISKTTIDRVLGGEGTVGEVTGTDLLTQFTWPAWVPREVHNQGNGVTYITEPAVGAALSQLPDPHTWGRITFVPQLEGPWEMVVEIKGRKKAKRIMIPGGGESGSGAKQVLDIVTLNESRENKKRLQRKLDAMFFEVTGTDEEVGGA